ncbi:glutamate formimidoyltransferase [Mucilaginibacter psychrotolerans]|uniref:glutamate formimidoyltransferase n=1 Tax=Mucilaginibacter psychrotolerans TaxID=1524096 RepID=A0A4Y8SPA4_9SPHI|nr:glutamate formimidoyltransferase [Mucilaginibacter psychrotolerans]TFF40768.1 glutamate formimidoyltransferase [Mucilaginibacter psychrotolerans]
MNKLIECVPNFSEGVNLDIIKQITDEIISVNGVFLLNIDPGKAANRTVVTFVGEPSAVIQAAFLAIKKAGELIDMSKQKGEHPRMGATDVCPLIPIANMTMEETMLYARQLAIRVGEELGIPVYLYEHSQADRSRSNLSVIRAGEYEGFFTKMKQPQWKPDYGPAENDVKRGATVIGARDLLIAYNVNLDTDSVSVANAIAFDVRESGRVMRSGDPVAGKVITDEDGKPKRLTGTLKSVKAIGWYIKEYGMAQVSMNLTQIAVAPIHLAFIEVCSKAAAYGTRVTGSELIGLIPLKAMLDAGKYFAEEEEFAQEPGEPELVELAIKKMGLDQLAPFNPRERIIEYLLEDAGASG